MKTIIFIGLLISLIFVSINSYALIGQWKLKNLDGQPTDKNIALNINEITTKDGQIINELIFENCHHISYQVQVKQNFMWFDNKTLKKTNQNCTGQQCISYECSQEESRLENRISQSLKKVFFFAIKTDLLVFVSPNGNDLFEFSRVKKVYLTDLTGNWILDEIYWERASQTNVLFSQKDKKVTFCSGKLETTYETDNIDKIQFTVTKNDNCQQTNITKALSHIRYFRLKSEVEMQLYSQDSIKIMQMFYYDDQNTIKKQEKLIKDEKNATADQNIKKTTNQSSLSNSSSTESGGSVTIIQSEKQIASTSPSIQQNSTKNLRQQQKPLNNN